MARAGIQVYRGDSRAGGLWEGVVLQQQCSDAIVEEDVLKGQSIRTELQQRFSIAATSGCS